VPTKKILSTGQPGIWDLDIPDKYTADYLTMFMHSLLKYHVTITQYVTNRITRSLLVLIQRLALELNTRCDMQNTRF